MAISGSCARERSELGLDKRQPKAGPKRAKANERSEAGRSPAEGVRS